MPIELPELDDKNHAELVQEARAALPGIAPGWTDHHPSDPGITLIELLAWLSEMLIYRTGRLPESNVRTFLGLLGAPEAAPGKEPPLEEVIPATMRQLRERWRAVTPEDYEHLTLAQWPGAAQLKRVRCLAERNLSGGTPTAQAPGHMSLIIVPGQADAEAPWVAPSTPLRDALVDFFRERRVVSTRLHITGPTYVRLSISATLNLRDDADAATVRSAAREALFRYFHPWLGGSGEGWPFGRGIHASDVYATLDGVDGVEFVEAVTLTGTGVVTDGGMMALLLAPHQLPQVMRADLHFTLRERRGDTWTPLP